MKYLYVTSLVAVITTVLFSCAKNNVFPLKPTKIDTSKTLISDTRLIGNWTIVKDTISFQGNNIVYQGTSTDCYKFTRYGNLYINIGLGNLNIIDTAVYGISSINDRVAWVNHYTSINGVSTTTPSNSLVYTITSINNTSLVLTQSDGASVGSAPHYEQIIFRKSQ